MNPLFHQRNLFLLSVIGSLVVVNLIGLQFFKRFDFTQDHAFTLSSATRQTLAALEDPISVKAYFTDKLPPPYSGNARYVKDLLEEFRAASKGKLSFEFIDPNEAESDQDKASKREVKQDIFGRRFREPTSLEKELAETGVQSVEIRVVEEDQVQTKRAYMGVVIKYGDKHEVIPVVQDLGALEYDLTSQIRKLTRTKAPVLAILQGHEEPKLEEHFRQLMAVLSETYTVRPLDLGDKDTIDDADGILILGPKTPFKPNELKAIDQFLMKGKSAAFFVDAVHVNLQRFDVENTDPGLAQLLQSYGVTLGDKLVADANSAQINIQEQRGFMTVSMPVPFPFIPLLNHLDQGSAVTKGLSELAIPFPTQLEYSEAPGRSATVLARSSPKSWLEGKPYNLDPRRDWRAETITPTGPYDLMLQVSGKLSSRFAAEANASSAQPVLGESRGEARIVVAGTSALFQDQFMTSSRTNPTLLLNLADWMLLGPSMLDMRSRGLAVATLKSDLSDGTRNSVKLGSALGIPILLALFGLLRWRLRESQRALVKV
jgi:gliding-associated putative ABC transporter substrate-binding component GldG